MNQARLLTILRAPHVTEKSALSSDGYRQYAFKVATDATKPEIKQAVEQYFKVKVHSVRTCNMKGGSKRFGRTMGRVKDWKKAYVALAQDQEIDIDKIE